MTTIYNLRMRFHCFVKSNVLSKELSFLEKYGEHAMSTSEYRRIKSETIKKFNRATDAGNQNYINATDQEREYYARFLSFDN